MPNCFNLTRKSDLAAGPVVLNVIDEEMCKHFGVEVDPKYWYANWYNVVGFRLAIGWSFEKIENWLAEEVRNNVVASDQEYMESQLAACRWLMENFTENAWVEIGKRR